MRIKNLNSTISKIVFFVKNKILDIWKTNPVLKRKKKKKILFRFLYPNPQNHSIKLGSLQDTYYNSVKFSNSLCSDYTDVNKHRLYVLKMQGIFK